MKQNNNSASSDLKVSMYVDVLLKLITIGLLVLFAKHLTTKDKIFNRIEEHLHQTNDNLFLQNNLLKNSINSIDSQEFFFNQQQLQQDLENETLQDKKKTIDRNLEGSQSIKMISSDSIFLQTNNSSPFLDVIYSDTASIRYFVSLHGRSITSLEELCYMKAKIPFDPSLPNGTNLKNPNQKVFLTIVSKESKPICMPIDSEVEQEIKKGNILEWRPGLCLEKLDGITISSIRFCLKNFGFDPGIVNNSPWDELTQQALLLFQEKYSLPTGTLNVETLKKLGFEIKYTISDK